jgi:hypothetical protein
MILLVISLLGLGLVILPLAPNFLVSLPQSNNLPTPINVALLPLEAEKTVALIPLATTTPTITPIPTVQTVTPPCQQIPQPQVQCQQKRLLGTQ